MQMFDSFEELTRFGESARQILVKSIARWTAAIAIAALLIASALQYASVNMAEIQAFLSALLPAANKLTSTWEAGLADAHRANARSRQSARCRQH
jgi:hypothetical protein